MLQSKTIKEAKASDEDSFDSTELQPKLINSTYDLRCTVENLDAELAQIENLKKIQHLKMQNQFDVNSIEGPQYMYRYKILLTIQDLVDVQPGLNPDFTYNLSIKIFDETHIFKISQG